MIQELEKARPKVLQSGSQCTSITCSDVEKYLGNAESVLWSPYELKEFCSLCMREITRKELRYLVDELEGIFQEKNSSPMWGAFADRLAHSGWGGFVLRVG